VNAGKLPPDALERLLSRIAVRDPRVLAGARVGEDAAVLEFGGRCLVAASDPVTFAADRIGWYAVHINANDIAVMGARPRWFLATLLLPVPALAAAVMNDILAACSELDVTLVGGHTEITAGIERPIVCGHMLGEVATSALVRKQSMRPGDAILLAGGIAVEGTAILAREKAAALSALPGETVAGAQRLLFDPGISVVRRALAAVDAAPGGVRAMHDPTEGGLVGGLCELAQAGGCGVRVQRAAIPILPETRALCAALGLDALRLIASGSLLIVVDREAADAVCAPTGAVRIGEVTGQGCWLDAEPLTFPAQDEISRALASPTSPPS
jgi:hydrogenase maturation factor